MNTLEWLVPFKERGFSGCCTLNFLARNERVYVMDNHRAALWCWLKHLPESGKVSLIHIDRHYDCLHEDHDSRVREAASVLDRQLEDYLTISVDYEGYSCPVFRWDNFLSIFFRYHNERIGQVHMATRKEGDPPEIHFNHIREEDLPSTLEMLAEDITHGPIIADLDLDFFMMKTSENECIRLFSEDYIAAVTTSLKKLIEAPHCLCLTIALSPECCGGWPQAEELLAIVCHNIGRDIGIPSFNS